MVRLKAGAAIFHLSLQPKEEMAGTEEKGMIDAADSIADATGIGGQLKSKISPLSEQQPGNNIRDKAPEFRKRIGYKNRFVISEL